MDYYKQGGNISLIFPRNSKVLQTDVLIVRFEHAEHITMYILLLWKHFIFKIFK